MQFASFKELIEYIRSQESLPYERDIEELQRIAERINCTSLPRVRHEDDRILIENGDLDEYALDNEVITCNEIGRYTFGFASSSGIVVTAKVGDLEFKKDSYNSKWECVGNKLKGLPIGYDEEELEDELHGDCYDKWDLLSEAIDEKLEREGLFTVNYRLFRSVEDDLYEIGSQLDDLGYDGFYFRLPYFYGWRKGMEEPWMNFDPIQLFSAEEVALRYAKLERWV